MVRSQRRTWRRTLYRSIHNTETAIVLGAFYLFVNDQAFGQMGIAMGAYAVRSIILVPGGSIDGISVVCAIEANDLAFWKLIHRAHRYFSVNAMLQIACKLMVLPFRFNIRDIRQQTFHVIGRIFNLFDERGNNLFIGLDYPVIGLSLIHI